MLDFSMIMASHTFGKLVNFDTSIDEVIEDILQIELVVKILKMQS